MPDITNAIGVRYVAVIECSECGTESKLSHDMLTESEVVERLSRSLTEWRYVVQKNTEGWCCPDCVASDIGEVREGGKR